jgi:hypothetical protein
MNIKEILEAIDEESGVEFGMVPMVRAIGWYAPFGSWEIDKPSPQNQGLGILAMFSVDGEWHVYAIPIVAKGAPPPTRYVLSKTAPCWSSETLVSADREGFGMLIDEIANERMLLAGVDDVSIECPKCHEDAPGDAFFCPECGEKLPDETPDVPTPEPSNGNAEQVQATPPPAPQF